MVLCALSLKQAKLLCGHEVSCVRLSVCLYVCPPSAPLGTFLEENSSHLCHL